LSFIRVNNPSVVVSALRQCERGGIILRVYEAIGNPAGGVEIEPYAPVVSVEEVDLMEDGLGELATVDGKIVLDLGPFEIRTIRLVLQGFERGE
jgi:alpha-mannosidase